MKKSIHLGLCCLLSGLMMISSSPIQSTVIETEETSHDGRTGRILSSVSEVVEGLVKLIKNPHEKANVLHNVGKMLAGIMNVAAGAVQKNAPLTIEEIDLMVAEIQALNINIDQSTQNTLTEHAVVMHNYLKSASAEELEAFMQRTQEAQEAELTEEETILDNEDHALQAGILGSLHQMIHELFEIIQNPENPQLIGQNIADILSNIMNVAAQAIKYEYMTAKNAEETVAQYIDSFSNELTKKITHLMLQTALNIRDGVTRSRSCCATTCSRSCCSNSCNTGCCKSNGCKPCCRTERIDEETDATRACGCCSSNCSNGSCCRMTPTTEDEITRKCCSCKPCCSATGNAGNCCRSATPDEETTRACCSTCNNSCGKCCRTPDAADDETTRACCNNSCGKCCRTTQTDDESTRACGCSCTSCSNGSCCRATPTGADEITRKCCSSCRPSCSSTGNCGNCCRSATPDEETTRACCSTCNNSCGKCCRTPDAADDETTRACCNNSCGKCCRTTEVTTRCTENCTCSPCECTPEERNPRCGCNKPKPTTVTNRDTTTESDEDSTRCGCGKPRPTTVTNRDVSIDESNSDDATRCGCGKPKLTQPTVTTRS